MKVHMNSIDVCQYAMIIFCHEYDKLAFIPDFPTRIDTAKKNFAESMLTACSCAICEEQVQLILNTNFYTENE